MPAASLASAPFLMPVPSFMATLLTLWFKARLL